MADGDSDGLIPGLIAAGIIVAIGYGIYRVIKSLGNFNEGDNISKSKLENSIKDFCSRCETADPRRCRICGSCLVCVGEVGWGECYVCGD